MIRKRIKNKIKNFELIKKKDRKRLANIGVISLMLVSVVSSFFLVSYADIIDEKIIPDDSVYLLINENTTQSQIIELSSDNITRMLINVTVAGTPTNNLNITIHEGYPWSMGPFMDERSISVSPSSVPVPGSGAWYEWNLTDFDRNYSIYTIKLSSDEPYSLTNYYSWQYDTDDIYKGGNIVTYYHLNTTYVNYTSWDGAIKVYGENYDAEDFTTWTEVDNANNTINVTDSNNVNVNVTRSDATYLYKDFGNYTNFSGKFTFKANEMKDTEFPLVGLILFTNTTGDLLATKTSKAIQIHLYGELLRIRHYNSSSGAWDVVSHNITIGNKYYVAFEKSGNDITLHCYNDTLLSDLYFTLSLYLYQPSVNYRYVETAVGTQLASPDATPEWANVTISNLNVSIAPSDTEDITIYNPSVNNTFIFNNEYNEYTNISVSSTAGTFRVYMYWNDSGTWRNYYDSGPGQSNGTFSAQNYNIPYDGSLFEWAVNVTADSGLYYRNQTFSFYSFDVNKPSCYDDDLSRFSPENNTAYSGSSIGRNAISSVFDGNNTVYVLYSNNRTGTNEQLCIRPYYINNQTWGIIYRFPITTYPIKEDDNHVFSTAMLDKYNHIWVVAGGHADASHPIYSFRSNHSINNPSFNYASSDEWVNGSGSVGKDIITSVTDSSYQKIWVGWNNTYAVFMRSGGLNAANSNLTLFWSFDNGTTWNSKIISDDEFYFQGDWRYDYGEDILFLTRWYIKFATGNSWANNYVSFFYITLNDTINNNGAYASNQTPLDTPYYSLPIHGTDIVSFDNFTSTLGLTTTASRSPVFYNTDTNEVYIFLNKDRTSTSTNFGKLAHKTLGTSKLWNTVENVSKIGDGIMIKNRIEKIHDGYYVIPLTEWNGANWELKMILTKDLNDTSTYNFRKITTTINETGDSPDNWVQENVVTFSDGYFTILTGDYDYDAWGADGGTRYMYMAYIDDLPTNQPPTVTITSPSEGANIIGNITITGTASDTDGSVQSVFVKIDSDSWQLATGTTSWSYAYNTTGLSDGTHTVYAKSFDGKDYSTEAQVNITFNATGFTDSGTAEPMTFPDTDINATDWVIANGNYLIITNNNKTIDGNSIWVMTLVPTVSNETLLEYIIPPGNVTGWKCYAKILEDDNVWHEISSTNAVNGWFYINDSIWDYSFDVGDHMYIRWAFNASMAPDYAGVYSGWSAWNISDSPGYPSDYEYNLSVTLTGEQPPNVYPPAKPYAYTPSSGEVISEGEYSLMQCLVYDRDSTYLSVSFYWGNGTLIGVDTSVSGNYGIASIEFPDVEVGQTYQWYAVADDGTYTNRSDNWTFTVSTGGEPPLVYSPSPTNGATNISLLPTLSVLVYDTDSDSISVTFYDSNNITIGIDTFINQMPPSPGQASVQWNNVILSNHTYQWYAVADDGDGNVVRYPTTGYLNFTTGISYPPVVTFQVKDTSGFPLSDVNISCSNLNQQILQYFVFKKTNYTTVKKTYTISTGQYYITLQYRATPTGDDTTNPTDIATIFVNYAQGSLGTTGLAFLSIILVILAMLIASKQFNTGNTTTLFIGASLFGLFIAIGWIPFWLLLLPFVIVALMFGGKIRDMIFGKSTGGDES